MEEEEHWTNTIVEEQKGQSTFSSISSAGGAGGASGPPNNPGSAGGSGSGAGGGGTNTPFIAGEQVIHLQFHHHKVILEEHQDLHQDHHMILHQEAQVEQVEQVAQVQMVLLEEQVMLM